MAWNDLKQTVADYVKANGNNEIEGDGLQAILKDMIDALGAYFGFVGVAVPTTVPTPSPDGFAFYLAGQNGLYSNFGAINLLDELAVLAWNGNGWQKTQVCSLSGGGDYYGSSLDEVTGYQGGAERTVLSVTVTRSGLYQVNSSVTVDTTQSGSGQDVGVGLAVNTVNTVKNVRAAGMVPSAAVNCTLSKVLSLNAGDTVSLIVYSTSNFYLAAEIPIIGKPCTFLDAVWLGE